MQKSFFIHFITALLTLFVVNSAFAESKEKRTEKSIGRAYNEQGRLLYIENHQSTFSGNQLTNLKTSYSKPESKKEFGSINSDFSKNPFVPTYQFKDERFGRYASIKWSDGKIISTARENSKEKETIKQFDPTKKTVTGQGLHNFLISNISEFQKNPKLKEEIIFLIPMNQDSYSFRIKVKELKEDTIQFRVEADSWLFRIVAPHIDVTYDLKSKRLLIYEGPSNLLTDDQKKSKVRIKYKYP